MKNILLIISFLSLFEQGAAQEPVTVRGQMVDIGKPGKAVIYHCKEEIKVDSRVLLKLENEELIEIYIKSDWFEEISFQDSIFPLIRERKQPFLERQLMDSQEIGTNHSLAIDRLAAKITLWSRTKK